MLLAKLRTGTTGRAVTVRLVMVRSVTARPLARPDPGKPEWEWESEWDAMAQEVATFTTPVRAIWARASGISTVQASFCNCSSRNRG